MLYTLCADCQSTNLEAENFQLGKLYMNFASSKAKVMEKDTEMGDKLKEKAPLIMAIVIGVALLLAIVIITSLLKLSFLT